MEGYLQELPGIRAEESMRRVTEIAIGSGTMEKSEQREIMDGWREAMGKRTERRTSDKLTSAQLRIMLSGLGVGIGVKEWPSAN